MDDAPNMVVYGNAMVQSYDSKTSCIINHLNVNTLVGIHSQPHALLRFF